jgi:hypothetical protein
MDVAGAFIQWDDGTNKEVASACMDVAGAFVPSRGSAFIYEYVGFRIINIIFNWIAMLRIWI